jgi:hypothetical protein
MGPLRLKILKNIGMKPPPPFETRIDDYTKFLSHGGFLGAEEKILVGVRGGGIAILKRIPEVMPKACTRNKIPFKLGDSVVVIDFLTKIKSVSNDRNEWINTPQGFIDYVRNTTGKMTDRFVHVKNIIIPDHDEGVIRDQHIPCEVRVDPLERFEGLDVFRISIDVVDNLRELELEIFGNEIF